MSLKEDAKNTVDAVIQSRDLLKTELSRQSKTLVESIVKNHEGTAASILRALSEAQKVEIQLLQSLKFSEMDDRHEQIAEAHRRTFRWILNDRDQENAGYSNFVEWLKKGSGIYWVNGKAGSGKSTLMRFAFNDTMTKNYLSAWAERKELELVGFFFWMNGSREQRSYSGLLRSLLYQALHKRPNLVRQIFPNEWNQSQFDPAYYEVNFSWKLSVLKAAFKRWIDLTSVSSKLCFFIDGLDEYDGDHDEMSEFFRDLSSIHIHVKFCVSSRPWVVFDEAFEGAPSLRLQDLTFADIKAYVFDKLESHCRMQQLVKSNQELASQLVTELVTKASGVFLWVTLVVRSLLDGLRNRDTILDLLWRLRELPDNLASLYSHMLKHVEPLYRRKTSETFQIFSAMEDDSVVPSIWLEIAVTGDTEHLKHDVGFYSSARELQMKIEWLDIHLKTRCAGLLEIVGGIKLSAMSREDYQGSKVSYLHRTVADFLLADDVRISMLEATDSDFDPNVRAIIARIFAMKKCRVFDAAWRWSYFEQENMWPFIEKTMDYARRVERADKTCYTGLMDDLERAAIQCWAKYQEETPKNEKIPFNRERYFRTGVIYELRTYIEEKLKRFCPNISEHVAKLLANASVIADKRSGVTSAAMYESILTGPWVEDPNHIHLGNSLWQCFLTEVHINIGKEWMNKEYLEPLAHIFRVMLERGANPQTTCVKNHPVSQDGRDLAIGCHTVKHVIISSFKGLLPGAYAELMQLLQKRIEIQEIKQRQQAGNFTARKRAVEPKEQGLQKRRR